MVCLILAVLIAWGMRFSNEDLFTALCAGRDVWHGNLGQPDTWSFATDGKLWVNQNWLSGVFYYASYLEFGEFGPFSIKVVLLVSCLVILYLQCRRLGADELSSLYALILGVLSVAPFWGIRPENFGVFFCVLFTAFLTAPGSWGNWKWVGSVLTIWIWSNSHGSFILGLFFLLVKFSVEGVRTFPRFGARTDQGGRKELVGLLVVFVFSVIVVALANPFGPANLFMPFTQVGTDEWIRQNLDWQPLYRWGTLADSSLFSPANVWPFLFLLLLMGALALVVVCKSPKAVASDLKVSGDILTEAVIFLIATVLSFRFKRLIPFAGMLAIPVLAYLIQSSRAAPAVRCLLSGSGPRGQFPRYLHAVCCLALLIFLTWAFSAKILVPHLPGNPMLPDMPLATQHMSWNCTFADLVKFLKANQLPTRVFSSWALSDFLVFHVPKIQIFVCGRAQTIYTAKNLREYLTIVRTEPGDPASAAAALRLLDDLRVDLVVLPETGAYGGLTDVLMKSRKWIGVYADGHALVLVRNETRSFRRIGNEEGFQALHYPDHRAEIVGKTLFTLGADGTMTAAQALALEDLARQRPDHSIYRLIGNGNTDFHGCLNAGVRAFLTSELNRLLRASFMTANGANSVIKSIVEIASILEHDAKSCFAGVSPSHFGGIADNYTALYQNICREFLP